MVQAGYRTKTIAVGQEWMKTAPWVVVSVDGDMVGLAANVGGSTEWRVQRHELLDHGSPWRCGGLYYGGNLYVVGHQLGSACGRELRIVGVVDATTLFIRADGGGEYLCDLAKRSTERLSLEAVPAVPAADPHSNWCERGVLSINERRADLGMTALPNGQGPMWATVDDLKAAGLLAAEMVDMGVRRMPMRLPHDALTVGDIVNHVASICDIGAKHVHASKKGGSLALFVDASGERIDRAREWVRECLPLGLRVTVEPSQMYAMCNFLAAVQGAVDANYSPRGQKRAVMAAVDEDARKYPAFADARRYAITAAYDGDRLHADAAPDLLAALRLYEDLRGIGAQPKQIALREFTAWANYGGSGNAMEAARVAYERARVPWRPSNKAIAPPAARPKRAQCISNVGADRAERFGSL